jgi:hypothetical protein
VMYLFWPMETQPNLKQRKSVNFQDVDIENFKSFSFGIRSEAILDNYQKDYEKLKLEFGKGIQSIFETTKNLPESPEKSNVKPASKEARNILKKWLDDNSSNPYPSGEFFFLTLLKEDEKKSLETETGLSRSQIDNCN